MTSKWFCAGCPVLAADSKKYSQSAVMTLRQTQINVQTCRAASKILDQGGRIGQFKNVGGAKSSEL